MNTDTAQVSVRILDKEYQVACPADERDALMASAALLDRRMKDIRTSGRVVGLDRIAVMAALNIANDLIAEKGTDDRIDDRVCQRIREMTRSLDRALDEAHQLEL